MTALIFLRLLCLNRCWRCVCSLQPGFVFFFFTPIRLLRIGFLFVFGDRAEGFSGLRLIVRERAQPAPLRRNVIRIDLQDLHTEQIDAEQQQRAERNHDADRKPRRRKIEADLVIAFRHADRHKTDADLFDLDRLAVDARAPSGLVGNAEENQTALIGRDFCREPVVIVAELAADVFLEDPAVGKIGPFVVGGVFAAFEVFDHAGVLRRLLLCHYHRAQQQQLAFFLIERFVFFGRYVAAVPEAHRDIVFVFPDVKPVPVAVVFPAGHRGLVVLVAVEIIAVAVVVEEPVAGGQAAQTVVGRIGAGADVTRDVDRGIELHDRSRNDAVEGLDARDLPEHRGIIERFVEIDTADVEIREIDVFAAVERVGDEMFARIRRLGLADRDHKDRIDNADQRQRRRSAAQELFAVFTEVEDEEGEQAEAEERDRNIAPKACRILLEAEHGQRIAVDIFQILRFDRHQTDQQRDPDGDRRCDPDRLLEMNLIAFERLDRCKGHQQRQHIVPTRVKRGVEELERGIEHRHERHDKEDHKQLFEPVGFFDPQKRDHAGHAEKRQPGPERRPL